jgi:hypothetical protein
MAVFTPNKYPKTGPNYAQYGEVAGYVYYPWDDSYYVDPNAIKEYNKQVGITPKEKGLLQQLTPVAAGAGAVALGQGLIKDPGALMEGLTSFPGKVVDGISTFGNKLTSLGQGAPSTGAEALATSTVPSTPTVLSVEPLTGTAANATGNAATGFGSTGTASTALGLAGAGYGAYQALEGVKNQNPVQAGLGGTALGLGLNATGLALGPVGWGLAVGVPAIGALAGKLFDKDEWKTEGKRLAKLRDQGVFVPQGMGAEQLSGGRSKEELIAIEKQNIAAGKSGNVKFAESRNEKDLTPMDIVGYATFAENDPQWFNRPVEERLQVAQRVLDQGLVRERKGTVDVNWSKFEPGTPKQKGSR